MCVYLSKQQCNDIASGFVSFDSLLLSSCTTPLEETVLDSFEQ